MSTKSKTLAKSLHTVSALVSVARHLQASSGVSYAGGEPCPDNRDAVTAALRILGYAGASDPYMLAARAVAILEGGK